MRERSIPFEERHVLLGEGSNWDAYRAFSPNGRVPCLVDGGTTVWESLAIAEYLAERHKGVWPDDPAARAWARCAAAEMHGAQDVRKPRMFRGRKDPPCRLQLMNLPHPLQPRMIDYLPLGDFARRQIGPGDKRQVAVDRIVRQVLAGEAVHGRDYRRRTAILPRGQNDV